MILLLVVGIVVALVFALSNWQSRQIQIDADRIALAAAASATSPDQGCQRAEELARQWQVNLAHCEFAGDYLDFVITVEISRNWFGTQSLLRAKAAAGSLQ